MMNTDYSIRHHQIGIVIRALNMLLLLICVNAAVNADTLPDIECENGDVCRDLKTLLPFRILARPFSNVYRETRATSSVIISENIEALIPYDVYGFKDLDFSNPLEPKGWYQVDVDRSEGPDGWMRAVDIMHWRNALAVAYSHPGSGDSARKPVLGFKKLTALRQLVESDTRIDLAKKKYQQLDAGQLPDDVIIRENPGEFLDIDEKFYLFPVIDWAEVELFDDPARYLNLVAAVPQSRATVPGEYTLRETDLHLETTEKAHRERLSDLLVDVVFAVDMTGSMGPYINMTMQTVQDLAIGLAGNPEVADKIRFGLVGYRDDPRARRSNEFASRVFTPQLVDANQLVQIISQDAVAKEGDPGWEEEVFAGMRDAVNASWRAESVRLIILIGDASANPAGHARNTTGLDAAGIRRQATDVNASVITIYLENERVRSDWSVAAAQFSEMALNPGSEQSDFMSISAFDANDYRRALKDILSKFRLSLDRIVAGDIGGLKKVLDAGGPADGAGGIAQRVLRNALVDYLGNEAEPPRDVAFWVFDRDVIEPEKPALSIRVMIQKHQLDSLVRALEQILSALRNNQITENGFMKTLQAIVSQSITDADRLNFTDASNLSETQLLPRWIENLPYKSKVQKLSDAQFAAMTPDARASLEREIDSLLSLYRDILSRPARWVKLNEKESGVVYPLPIGNLP